MSPLRILMVTAELAPLAKAGGLADMVAGLSGALASAGHDVRILLPYYRGQMRPSNAVTTIAVPEPAPVRVGAVHPPWSFAALPAASDRPRVYLLDAPLVFDSGDIYGSGDAEALRFALLSHAALALVRSTGWIPDIIHCHDWHTGLTPLLLHQAAPSEAALRNTYSVLTIHNIGYQGLVDRALISDLGLAACADRLPEPADDTEPLNLLQTGILHADALTTVSPSHALEIQTPAFGMGLDALLRQRSHRLVGILNGVDYASWDPATDPLIPANYGPGALEGKAACRRALAERVGLACDEGTPLVGMVSRLADQKGIPLVLSALPELLEAGKCRAVVLGDGEARHVAGLAGLADRYAGSFAFVRAHDEALARTIIAGADMLLVPSLYEPCGLTQMYALRYGTVPVVRETGGLKDTIRHFDPATRRGNGSVFKDADPGGLRWGLGEALGWYAMPEAWRTLQQNGMQADFSWRHQAPGYERVYGRLAGR